jgi:hypothetical protein
MVSGSSNGPCHKSTSGPTTDDATSARVQPVTDVPHGRLDGVAGAAHLDHAAEPLMLAAAPEPDALGLDRLFQKVLQDVVEAVRVDAPHGERRPPLPELAEVPFLP